MRASFSAAYLAPDSMENLMFLDFKYSAIKPAV